MPTLHVYLDESGEFNFTPKSQKYYVFAATWTYNPLPLALSLNSLRFQLLKNGLDLAEFHASRDHPKVRDAVLTCLASESSWHYCAVVVEKVKVNPILYRPHLWRFYSYYAAMPFRFIFQGHLRADTERVLIYTDSLPNTLHREPTTKAIQLAISKDLPSEIPFHIYHHSSASNVWLQVADYCCWVVRRKWESHDFSCYNRLLSYLIEPELDALANEEIRYY